MKISPTPALFSPARVGFHAFVLFCLSVTACKKDHPAPVFGNGDTTKKVTVINVQPGSPDFRDSLANYAYDFYLWNNNFQKTFNPHIYPYNDTLTALVKAIQDISPVNPVNSLHYDHFSFVLTEADYNNLFVNGVSVGFGMNYKFDRTGTLRVAYAAHASSAYMQGVRRGFKITSVNGIVPATDAATIQKLNAALNTNSVAFGFTDPGTGQSANLTLAATSASDDEVIASGVYTAGTKTVGYMAYNTFLTANNNGNITHPGLDSAFRNLAAAGVTDLVVDLRYNGGGYTDVAAQLDNAVIPAVNNGKLLYSERYNDTLNHYYNAGYKNLPHDTLINVNKSDPKNPPALSINSITFIVSKDTYSAAELVINNLFPYLPTKLIGVNYGRASNEQNTGGKPFGFFNWPMPQKNPIYEAFLINFETKNASGQDNYVSGFVPDLQTYDGVEFDWGNPKEDGLQAALNYYATGALTRPANPVALSNSERIQSSVDHSGLLMNSRIAMHRFQGMIHARANSRSFSSSLPRANHSPKLGKTKSVLQRF